MAKITVIILTYNSIKFIPSCLDSVVAQEYEDFEIIIIDNGSKDGTVSLIKEKYPQAMLIENEKNQGAAKARNQGIEIAKGEWLLTLDCDAILQKDFLSEMVKAKNDCLPEVGMIQPKILRGDRKTIYSCGIYLSWLRRFYDIGNGEDDGAQYNSIQYIFGVCSAAGFFKRQMLDDIKEKTSYFDERFFFLAEDVDLSWRAQKRGWRAFYYPKAVCSHQGNSSGIPKEMRQRFCFRNWHLLIIKNEKFGIIWKMPYYLVYDILKVIFLITNCRKIS